VFAASRGQVYNTVIIVVKRIPAMQEPIEFEDIAYFEALFDEEPANRVALNAVTQNGLQAAALNREVVNRSHHSFSHLIKTPKATDQKASGRCWLFAGLNALRLEARRKLNLKKFELSQTYLMFWDKLEKANFFLESILETLDEPLDGRLMMWLLDHPIADGGQWDMFVSLVRKYGVLPKGFMPETFSSSTSAPMNRMLTSKLRRDAASLRQMHAAGAGMEELREEKDVLLAELYRMLAIHLGQPPQSFVWQWRDQDGEFHRHGKISPQEFFAEYVGSDLDDLVCLINAPTADKPYDRTYTVQYLGNVVDGQPVRYLNVAMDTFKHITCQSLADGQAVWFGCDVGKLFNKELGILDLEVYDLESLYGMDFRLDKGQRLDYGESQMTHAMVLTGVNLDETGQPNRWRVENSWGRKYGDKGFLVMSDAWFEEFMYEVAVSKRYLSPELLAALEAEPVVLPPWDPMGSLAGAD
jgi:bleomycin hydrolase